MSTALSKAEQNALAVSYEVMGSQVVLDLAFARKYLVRGREDLTTDQELVFFMNTCKQQGLNPLVGGEAYVVITYEADKSEGFADSLKPDIRRVGEEIAGRKLTYEEVDEYSQAMTDWFNENFYAVLKEYIEGIPGADEYE